MKKILIFFVFILFMSCSNSEKTDNKIINEQDIQNIVNSALKHQEEDNFKLAAKDFEEALKIKEDASLRVCLGSAYVMSCDFENAIKNFKIAVKNKEKINFDDYVLAMLGIINASNMLCRFQDAYDTSIMFQNEISFSDLSDGKKIDALVCIAKAKCGTGRYQEALKDFKTAMSVENRGYLYVGLSRVQTAMGDFKDAVQSCLKAVSIEDSMRTRMGLGEAKEKSGDLTGALNEYKIALTKKSMGKTRDEINFEIENLNNFISRVEREIQNMK